MPSVKGEGLCSRAARTWRGRPTLGYLHALHFFISGFFLLVGFRFWSRGGLLLGQRISRAFYTRFFFLFTSTVPYC